MQLTSPERTKFTALRGIEELIEDMSRDVSSAAIAVITQGSEGTRAALWLSPLDITEEKGDAISDTYRMLVWHPFKAPQSHEHPGSVYYFNILTKATVWEEDMNPKHYEMSIWLSETTTEQRSNIKACFMEMVKQDFQFLQEKADLHQKALNPWRAKRKAERGTLSEAMEEEAQEPATESGGTASEPTTQPGTQSAQPSQSQMTQSARADEATGPRPPFSAHTGGSGAHRSGPYY